jgi:hypothetical protein
MKSIHLTRAAIVAGAGLLAATAALAEGRDELIQAPGACVGNFPTDNVRNRVGGVRNADVVPLYIICSMSGDWEATDGHRPSYNVAVRLYNAGEVEVTAQCTLHTGYGSSSTSTNQGAFVQTAPIAAGDELWFEFAASDYLDNELFTNASFICKLNQKVEVQYVYRYYDEDVGA